MEFRPKQVRSYIDPERHNTFGEWLDSIKDKKALAIILERINRLRLGNLGECRHFGQSLYELKIHFGPGYRIYFGELDRKNVVLLWGGIKRTQKRDIKKAKKYWQELKSRK